MKLGTCSMHKNVKQIFEILLLKSFGEFFKNFTSAAELPCRQASSSIISKFGLEIAWLILGMCRIDFFYFGSVQFLHKTQFRFGMSLWFGSVKKTWFGLDIIVIYFSCSTCANITATVDDNFDVTDVTHNNDKK